MPRKVWVAPGVDLARAIPPDGDPDRLLTAIACRIVKLQPKVIVGRAPSPIGPLFVKRYNVFSSRVAVRSLFGPSPAERAWAGAAALAARGFAVPEVVAALEYRRAGMLARSFIVTHEVTGAVTADARFQAILAEPVAARRRGRRALARALGDLFRRLHAAGVYHRDLKDANILVRGPLDTPECVLLDLEQVRLPTVLGRERRVKNLVQLARTLGRLASAGDRLRFLAAYLGAEGGTKARREWAASIGRAVARKDRGRPRGGPTARPRISCTVVCQNESATIGYCLESVTWCDEVVVVDGGSRDDTVAKAHRFTDRVLVNAWPGYRAQKQFALEAAGGDWVLNVDADERVTPELASEVRAVLARVAPDVGGFAVPRLVCYLGRWWYRGGWYPRRVLRVMRRSAARWGGIDPHERAEVTGPVLPLAWPILHYTYADIADHLRSVNKLTEVAAHQDRLHRRVGAGRLVLEPAWRFVRSYLVQRGVLDGFPGLFVSATGAFYVFVRWAKIWEQQRARPAALDGPERGS